MTILCLFSICELPSSMSFLCLLPCDDRHKYDRRCRGGQEVYYICRIFPRMYDMQTESFPLEQQFHNHKILVQSNYSMCKRKKAHGPNSKKQHENGYHYVPLCHSRWLYTPTFIPIFNRKPQNIYF